MSKLNRVLLVIVLILAAATALVWFKPELLSSFSLSNLNPFSRREKVAEVPVSPVEATVTSELPSPSEELTSVETANLSISNQNLEVESANKVESAVLEGEKVEELSTFEKEIKQRHESYQTKIYTYEPYQPLVMRNPFQRIISTVYLGDEEGERMAKELRTEEDIRRFVQPELPPKTKYSGLISSGDTKLAIIGIEDETYIVKEGDVILDEYLAKSVQKDKVIFEINGYDITLILGGEGASND